MADIGPHMPQGTLRNTYQLTPDTVSPTRQAGTDEAGIPREETICVFSRWARFVDREGNIMDVPLSNGRVFSREQAEENYKQLKIREQVLSGALPLEHCPYTEEFAWVRPGPLVTPPAGVKACKGDPDGCEHMKPIIEERRRRSRARHDAIQAQRDTMTVEQAHSLVSATAKELGYAIADKLGGKGGIDQARANLRGDKGER